MNTSLTSIFTIRKFYILIHVSETAGVNLKDRFSEILFDMHSA